MRKQTLFPAIFSLLFTMVTHANNRVVIVENGISQQRISMKWKDALASRMPGSYVDSLSAVPKNFSAEEQQWEKLILSKTELWNSYRDSLSRVFPGIELSDTIYVLLGCGGADDGFTYKHQTVCFDLTALQENYGNAALPENNERMNRLFAHEFTHLLHKAWAINYQLKLGNFRDSILWECLYEGIGMYRSLNPRWLPVDNELPQLTQTTLNELYPVFTERMLRIHRANSFTGKEKEAIHKNLSRGPVNKKWGALPVAIWLALEAKQDERKLATWINKGPQAVVQLAMKYLPASNLEELSRFFEIACE